MPRIKEFDYDQVLEDAMQLFWKKGYHATSMDDLVQHLGINRSSIYNSFGGKKEIFLKGIKLYQSQNLNSMRKILESETSTKNRFKKLFESAIQSFSADSEKKGCFIVNTSTEMAANDKEIKKFLIENKRIVEDFFLEFLQEGVKQKEIRKSQNLREFAEFLFMLYSGLGVISKLEVSPSQTKFLLEHVIKMLEN